MRALILPVILLLLFGFVFVATDEPTITGATIVPEPEETLNTSMPRDSITGGYVVRHK